MDVLALCSGLNALLGDLLEKDNRDIKDKHYLTAEIYPRWYDLKSTIQTINFEDEASEMHFFKHAFTDVASQLMYLQEIDAFESQMALFTTRKQKQRIQRELKSIDTFFHRHNFFYHYFQSKLHSLDDIYFIRNNVHTEQQIDLPLSIDERCETIGSYYFTRFKAYGLFHSYLTSRLRIIARRKDRLSKNWDDDIRWTGEIVNLVEIVYGIYETEQVNRGEITLSKFINSMSLCFNVDVVKFQKAFMTIKSRKKLSKTRFLDEMKEMLLRKIDQADEWIAK